MFEHFVAAQQPVYVSVLRELSAGRKQSHWMWFVFPQLRALGRSPTALKFGLTDIVEAKAYARDPLLGARLRECTALALAVEGKSLHDIFGSPDDVKFRSSMTLFWRATGDPVFRAALDKFCGGEEDPLTLRELQP